MSGPRRPAIDSLRLEYARISDDLLLIRNAGFAVTPSTLRLEARQMEIVDLIANAGLAPDVLVKGVGAFMAKFARPDDIVRCDGCDNGLESGWTYCAYCGRKIEAEAAA